MRISTIMAALFLGASAFVSVPTAGAQTEAGVEAVQEALPSGTFVKKKKSLAGGWEVVERDGNTYIVFSDDFKTSNGPDLKVFLSPTDIASVTGKTATDGSINIGELQKTKGAQEYLIPAEINLADYSSVLVHCEKYSILSVSYTHLTLPTTPYV